MGCFASCSQIHEPQGGMWLPSFGLSRAEMFQLILLRDKQEGGLHWVLMVGME